jgi:hypothetical protein
MDANKNSVKRCLWPVDHAAVRQDLDKATKQMEQKGTAEMKAKYNFDPISGKPLEGPWKWESSTPPQTQESQAPVDTEKTEQKTSTDNSAKQPPHTP